MNRKNEALKQYFGHTAFREGQEGVVDSLLAGRDVLAIMPTGAGKSVCYQIPALLLPGVTLVISPLISLMKDQVTALVQNGIPAAYINSSLTPGQHRRVLANLERGDYKIVYVAPERLVVPEFIQVCMKLTIPLVAVDEAHCVSQWGQDFRPGYLKIAEFVSELPTRPTVGAFTATATGEVREDMEKLLHLENPYVKVTGFDRPNLYFSVLKPKSKPDTLLRLIDQRREQYGIVYCSTRKTVEEVWELLRQKGIPAGKYHAGMTDEDRKSNQEDFIYDRIRVMAATNAFGMGIDKSNVSYVIHYNMPKDMESYYQEAGRAGRDGSPAECILLYAPKDVQTNRFLISNSEPNPELTPEETELLRVRDNERLRQMTFYSTGTDCLRAFILRYFGEKSEGFCGNCSNCNEHYEMTDITIPAQMLLSCVIRTGQRFGRGMITDILKGRATPRITELGFTQQSTFGKMKETDDNLLRGIFNYLEKEGYLLSEGTEYPVLKATEKSREVLKGLVRLEAKLNTAPTPEKAEKKKSAEKGRKNGKNALSPADEGLFDELRRLRKALAAEAGVPAYVIFTDATLGEMSEKKPEGEGELMQISGVGQMKIEKYGEVFLRAIREYGAANEGEGSIRTDSGAAEGNRGISGKSGRTHGTKSGRDDASSGENQRYSVGGSVKRPRREKSPGLTLIEPAPTSPSDVPAASTYAPWTQEEVAQLRQERADGMTVAQIAASHGRSMGAICQRLAKEGIDDLG